MFDSVDSDRRALWRQRGSGAPLSVVPPLLQVGPK